VSSLFIDINASALSGAITMMPKLLVKNEIYHLSRLFQIACRRNVLVFDVVNF